MMRLVTALAAFAVLFTTAPVHAESTLQTVLKRKQFIAGISQRKPFATSVSTLLASTCGWPHGTPASLQMAKMSSIAAATSGCSYWRG